MAKILISDDNKDFAELLDELLGSNGYETHVTFDGLEAINHLKKTKDYDLVITDIIMPRSDGFDVINFVKKETTAKTIAISGGGVLVSPHNAIEAISSDVDASLEKPVKLNELLECVESVLHQ